ncbi:DUF4240 domain-containing protein [Sphaerisporangium sp. NPDC051011]|uniref:DUF4240 domain-containing protein n=1 Tax=Sphaerisporangium sp. NPDC051011 TaxID=3155792 RepID=UPI0033FA7EC6
MDIDGYWALIEGARAHTEDLDERAEWLVEQLARRTPAQIIEFELRHAEVRKAADTWPMWGAAMLLNDGWCSDDVFWYFQAWVIGLGQQVYERATAAPDTLLDAPEVRHLASGCDDAEPPEWEILDYVANDAYERVTGEEYGLWRVLEERGIDLPRNPAPADDGIEGGQAEHARYLPRLCAAFPFAAPA